MFQHEISEQKKLSLALYVEINFPDDYQSSSANAVAAEKPILKAQ